jgi:hypothetical protein
LEQIRNDACYHNLNITIVAKTFLANSEITMEPSKAVKEYKEELVKS